MHHHAANLVLRNLRNKHLRYVGSWVTGPISTGNVPDNANLPSFHLRSSWGLLCNAIFLHGNMPRSILTAAKAPTLRVGLGSIYIDPVSHAHCQGLSEDEWEPIPCLQSIRILNHCFFGIVGSLDLARAAAVPQSGSVLNMIEWRCLPDASCQAQFPAPGVTVSINIFIQQSVHHNPGFAGGSCYPGSGGRPRLRPQVQTPELPRRPPNQSARSIHFYQLTAMGSGNS